MKKSGFTLVEVLVSAAIGSILILFCCGLMVGVARSYAVSEKQKMFSDQARLIDLKIRNKSYGVGFYEIYDWYPQVIAGRSPVNASGTVTISAATKQSGGASGDMMVLAMTDSGAALSSNAVTALNGVVNPPIRKLVGYYIDASDSRRPVLRYFDSSEYVKLTYLDRENMGPNLRALADWARMFPVTLNTAAGRVDLSSMLPPASALSTFPVICDLDPQFVKASVNAWQNKGANLDLNTGFLRWQTFYPQANQVLINFSTFSGSPDGTWVTHPLTFTIALHK